MSDYVRRSLDVLPDLSDGPREIVISERPRLVLVLADERYIRVDPQQVETVPQNK